DPSRSSRRRHAGEPAEELAPAPEVGHSTHLLDEAAARRVAVGAAAHLFERAQPLGNHRPWFAAQIAGAQVQLLDAGRHLAEMVHVEEALAGPARRAHVALEEPIERLEVAAEGDQLRIARLQLEQLRPQAWRGHRVPRLAAPVAVGGEQGALVADAVFL